MAASEPDSAPPQGFKGGHVKRCGLRQTAKSLLGSTFLYQKLRFVSQVRRVAGGAAGIGVAHSLVEARQPPEGFDVVAQLW